MLDIDQSRRRQQPELARDRGGEKSRTRRDRGGVQGRNRRRILAILVGFAACGGADAAAAQGSTSREDVPRIGLAPLYEALVAVANCPDLVINRRNFAAVARGYHLRPDDFTPYGRFGPEIVDLSNFFAIRVRDDRDAFCSSARLSFAVLHGVLAPPTPEGPRPPFPFRRADP